MAGILVALAVAAPMFYVWLGAQNMEPDELATLPGVVASVGLLIPPAIGVAAGFLVASGNLIAGLVAPLVGVGIALALLFGAPVPKGPRAGQPSPGLGLWAVFLLPPAIVVGAMILASAVF